MTTGYSAVLRLGKPEVGADESTWGTILNTNTIDMLDEAIGGYVSIALAGSNITLTTANGTTDQARSAIIKFTGTPGATRTVTAPDVEKTYWVYNATTDSSSLTFKSGAGTSVTLLSGAIAKVYCDGATNTVALYTSQGTTTNDAAAAGFPGQLIKTTVASGSAVALTSTVTVDVATIALTAGDWDVSGVVHFTGGGTTTISTASAAISGTSVTFPSYGVGDTDRTDSPSYGAGTPFSAGGIDCVMGPTRVSLAAPATYYLIAVSVFGVSTCSVFGTIRARRVR